MKTFLASTLTVLCASFGLMMPAQAQRPGLTPKPNPGTPLPNPIPRPSQQVVGQNSGNLSTNVARPAIINASGLNPAASTDPTTIR
jgi:hypothetical protein